MNRAERRKLGIKERPKTYTLNDEAVERIKKKVYLDSMTQLICLPLMAAHDEFGFGEKRLLRLMNRLIDYVHDVQEGRWTIDELRTIIKGECGIDIGYNSMMDKIKV